MLDTEAVNRRKAASRHGLRGVGDLDLHAVHRLLLYPLQLFLLLTQLALRRRLRDRGLQVHLHGHPEATATWAAEAGSISAAPSSASTKPYATPRSISAATFAATT